MTSPPVLAPTRRLFIGLLPDPAVRQALLDWRARWQWPSGTALAAPAHVHLTLFFLGDTDEARIHGLEAALSRVAVNPFMLRLGAPEAWHRGLLVLRPQPSEALEDLHQRMGLALQAAGFAGEGEGWKPHVTLARKAPQALPPADPLDIAWPVRGFALVWSRLPPQVPRARYETVRAWGDVPSLPSA